MQYNNKDNFSNNRSDIGSNNKVNLRSDTSWLGQVLKPVVIFGLGLLSIAIIYVGIAFAWILEALAVVGVIWLFVGGMLFLTIQAGSRNAVAIGTAIGTIVYHAGQARRNLILAETPNAIVLDGDDGPQVFALPSKETIRTKEGEEDHPEVDGKVLLDLHENHGVSQRSLAQSLGVNRSVVSRKMQQAK